MSSEVEVKKFDTYIQITYGGAQFYVLRDQISPTSSNKGITIFDDKRRDDQLDSESILSHLSVHEEEIVQAIRMAYLMEAEFSVHLFAWK